jgi:hypothetical protein
MDLNERMETLVNTALNDYSVQGVNAVSAGFNILRYAKAGYVGILNPMFTAEFMEWYPGNPDYLILRMALKGQLAFRPQQLAE